MEIEVKLKYSVKSKVTEWLNNNGFTLTKNKEVRDSYYGLPDGTMSNKGSLYRIRNVAGVLQELTLKDGLEDKNSIWTRREINVSVNDTEAMSAILSSLNCKLIKENFSKREIWTKEKIEFAFIDFSKPAELHIAEIEGPDHKTVQKCIESLGNIVEIAGEEVFSVFDKKTGSNPYEATMIHEMRLHEAPFEAIKHGRQTIETRIYDDKRKLIQIGDQIVFFKRPEEIEKLTAKVIGLSIFRSFKDLFKSVNKKKFGYDENDTLEYQINCMRKYYSKDEEKKYGVVGIHIELIVL